jgi:hypothetical protein
LQIEVIRARGNLTKISSCETVTPEFDPNDVPKGRNFGIASENGEGPQMRIAIIGTGDRRLQYDRPVWRTVKGGSQRYVEKLTFPFGDQLRLGCAATSIQGRHAVSSSTTVTADAILTIMS